MLHRCQTEKGSIELVVLGLLAALIVVLAIPMLSSVVSDPPPVEEAEHTQVATS